MFGRRWMLGAIFVRSFSTLSLSVFFFFFQAEDGIRDVAVTGVQTCALPISVAAALKDVDGAYGLAFISSEEPDVLVAARKGSPLLVGVGEDEWFVASDASPLLEHTRSVVYLDDGEMAVLSRDGYRVRNLETTQIEKPVNQIDWDLATIERNGYPH